MSNLNYDVIELSKDKAVNQKKLSRLLRSKTGMTSIEFLLEVRLQKARQLIERNIYNSLIDICREITIESVSYFSKKFKERKEVSLSSLLSR